MTQSLNNEILEISKWLHEKGFECDMWVHDDLEQTEIENQRNAFVISNVKVIDHTYGEYNDSESDIPYFTLEDALSSLEILTPPDCILIMIRTRIGYAPSWEDHAWNHMTVEESCCDVGYHLAALRLLKKTVEEGYAKPI